MTGYAWTDLVTGFTSNVSPLNALGQKVQDLDNPGAWQTATLVNGWTGTLRYRLFSFWNLVFLSGSITAGTKADGTTFTTLLAGFRPISSQDVLVSCNNVVGGGQNPHASILNTGVMACWGVTAASGMSFNQFFPTDI